MKSKYNLLHFMSICYLLSACANTPDMATAKHAEKQQDYKTSIDHYQRLADFGLPQAQMELGKYYLEGKGIEKNPAKALDLFQQASQSTQNSHVQDYIVKTQTQIGSQALAGTKGAPPVKEGIQFLKSAAAAGDRRALFELGTAYEQGVGVSKNISTAISYYEKSSALGYGRSDYNLAKIYEKGIGVPKNPEKAATLYKNAIAKDYPRANVNLGRLYEKGIGVPQNLKLAHAYYQKAGASNIPVDKDLKRLQKN